MFRETSLAKQEKTVRTAHPAGQFQSALKIEQVHNRAAEGSFYSSGNLIPKPTSRSPVMKHEDSSNPHGIHDAFVKVCHRWQLSKDDQYKLLGFEPEDPFCYRLLNGSIRRASVDVEDRAGYVVSIGLGLFRLLGKSKDAEIEWLNHPRARLQDKSPLSVMLEGHMENLYVINSMVRHERGL